MNIDDYPPGPDHDDRPVATHRQEYCPSEGCKERRLFPRQEDGTYRCLVCRRQASE